MKIFYIFLLIEAIILLVTLALQAWALHILALSCSYARQEVFDGYQNVPNAQLYTLTETQVVTGYHSTSTEPASTSVRTTIYAEVPLDQKTFVTTQRDTAIFTPQPIGFRPTATITRTVTTTGLQDVRAGIPPHDFHFSSYPTSRPEVVNKRQNNQGGGDGVSIFPTGVWSLDTSFDFNKYRTITVNHGFGKHFVEAGIDYDYGSTYAGGYTRSDYARIAGLTTLMACAIFAVLIRLSMTTIRIMTINYHEEVKTNKSRKTFYANLAATILLIASCLAFWIIYGYWIHPSAELNEAYQAVEKESNYIYLNIVALFKVEPWKGTPIALITFWCISCVTSLIVCILW